MLLLLLGFAGCSSRFPAASVSVGARPDYLLDLLAPGPLKDRLETCRDAPVQRSRFSIAHRGAPLQFPEHTRESYRAAARMGAGIIECDVTFTRDRALVCRHSQCDLHATTDILLTPLADRCQEPFTPARFDPTSGALLQPARALCCTHDITLAEFKSLRGKMDAVDPHATSAEEFVAGTPDWRTDLYSGPGTLMTHAESIALFRELGVGMTPELKAPMVEMPFEGDFTRQDYARKMLSEYREAGVPPDEVYPQSFDLADLAEWREFAPEFSARSIWLDGSAASGPTPTAHEFEALHRDGVRILAPPISRLLALDEEGEIRPSQYAQRARAANLELIAWSLERSGRIEDGRVEGRARDYYLQPILSALENDGDLLRVLDVLARQVHVRGVFSDWPATTTFYASCFGLE